MLRVYNTLTQRKEEFEPIDPPRVGMYVCGPTVYSKSHIGHMVGPVIFDTIKRYLTFRGFQVTWVVNITDVDDKLIVQAAADGVSVKDLAERVTQDYLACLSALGVDGIDQLPRATEHIDGIINITESLIEKGFAYPSNGDVYFDVSTDSDYGKLSHRRIDELLAGARIDPSEKKRNPGDFALWKSSKPGEPAWDSPWGPGRPGWHIECTAMSMKLLGKSFDIHGGGLDLVFPHHENEVAQSESYSGRPFVKYWLHNGLLTKEGKKISKSDPGTIVLMSDLLERHDSDTLRALLLSSHYRRPIDYGPGRLDEIDRGLQAFRNLFDRFDRISGTSYFNLPLESGARSADRARGENHPEVWGIRDRLLEAMDDDFNTGGALGELYELVRTLNRMADTANFRSPPDPEDPTYRSWVAGIQVLRELSGILGLFLKPARPKGAPADTLAPKLLDFLVELRNELRKAKQFALADRIRARLAECEITLEDRPEGTAWRTG
jgi:cysteinyl-tRNA synthetase